MVVVLIVAGVVLVEVIRHRAEALPLVVQVRVPVNVCPLVSLRVSPAM